MKNEHPHMESLLQRTEDYLETKASLFKLKTIDKSAGIISSIIARLIITFFVTICFLMLNVGIAILIGNSIGEVYYGFFIVAAFYIIVIAILLLSHEKWLKVPINNLIIKSIFN